MLDLLELASEDQKAVAKRPNGQSWVIASTAVGGLAGTLLWKEHPILGLLGGFAVGGNLSRLYLKQIKPRRAAENIGAHLVATTGALALPKYPALGYLAGAFTGNLFIRRDDTLIQRFDETVLGDE